MKEIASIEVIIRIRAGVSIERIIDEPGIAVHALREFAEDVIARRIVLDEHEHSWVTGKGAVITTDTVTHVSPTLTESVDGKALVAKIKETLGMT